MAKAAKSRVADTALNALQHFESVLHPKAVIIFTPFTKRVSLNSCKVSPVDRVQRQGREETKTIRTVCAGALQWVGNSLGRGGLACRQINLQVLVRVKH